MTNKTGSELTVASSNPGEAQDLLMEAGLIIEFLEEMACHSGEAKHAIHETCGLIYILRDVKDRVEKADQIIEAYKAEKKEGCQP